MPFLELQNLPHGAAFDGHYGDKRYKSESVIFEEGVLPT